MDGPLFLFGMTVDDYEEYEPSLGVSHFLSIYILFDVC